MTRWAAGRRRGWLVGIAFVLLVITGYAQGDSLPRSGYVVSNDLRIHFATFGSGPPLVLVHGWGADLQSNWVETGWVDALQNHRTVIAIDVRGHGRSDKPREPHLFSYAAMSADVLAVMDALDLETAEFVGYSMGAFMGAWLLGHHPQRFPALVLGGIGDETPESAAQGAAIAEALRADLSGADTDATSHGAARAVRQFVAANPRNDFLSLAASAEQMWPEGYPLDLAGAGIADATMRVLIVNGSEDVPYVDSADRFADVLPNGRHVRIPGTDHLTTVADPRFKQAVLAFLLGG